MDGRMDGSRSHMGSCLSCVTDAVSIETCERRRPVTRVDKRTFNYCLMLVLPDPSGSWAADEFACAGVTVLLAEACLP